MKDALNQAAPAEVPEAAQPHPDSTPGETSAPAANIDVETVREAVKSLTGSNVNPAEGVQLSIAAAVEQHPVTAVLREEITDLGSDIHIRIDSEVEALRDAFRIDLEALAGYAKAEISALEAKVKSALSHMGVDILKHF